MKFSNNTEVLTTYNTCGMFSTSFNSRKDILTGSDLISVCSANILLQSD